MEVVNLNDDSPGITLSEPSIFIAVNGPRKGDVLEVLETLNSETIGGQVTGAVYPVSPYERSAIVPFERNPITVRTADGDATTAYTNREGQYNIEVPEGSYT